MFSTEEPNRALTSRPLGRPVPLGTERGLSGLLVKLIPRGCVENSARSAYPQAAACYRGVPGTLRPTRERTAEVISQGERRMEARAILQPVFVVGLLTIVMAIWMVATRIPAMVRKRIDPQLAQTPSHLHSLLPPELMRISNNYNHLFEQPTLFYAVAISIALLGHVDAFNVGCAWVYAVLRIAHSLVQATIDLVTLRFGIFLLSWIVLATLTLREALVLF